MSTNGFAFYNGTWDIINRRRGADGVWREFAATGTVDMEVDGLIQVDRYDAPDFPGRGHVKAVTVRAYDREADTWSIIWLSNYAPPDFEPLVGRWDGDTGEFRQSFTDDDGAAVDAKFLWYRFDDDHAKWEQYWSRDGGATWDQDWTMEMTRTG